MEYTCCHFSISPIQPFSEILVAELAEIGFESFAPTPVGVDAYLPGADLPEEVKGLVRNFAKQCSISYTAERLADQNWNQVWEASFQAIEVGTWRVRAPHHSPALAGQHDLIILPKMSFGTGHHHTTALMLQRINEGAVQGKRVLDVGCGTGILAIAAALCGAGEVRALDIEQWAVHNSLENAQLNKVAIVVHRGGIDQAGGGPYDVIFANINRNVLVADMHAYAALLSAGGKLLLSGFLSADVGILQQAAERVGLHTVDVAHKADWYLLELSNHTG